MVFKPMKRKQVVTALKRHDCRSVRNVGGHEIWYCPCGQHSTALPNHTTITAGVANSITKQLACLPKGWLQ